MNDYLIPDHYRQNELSGDFDNLSMDDQHGEHGDGSLIKKKVSIKRLSEIVKSPIKPGGTHKRPDRPPLEAEQQDQADDGVDHDDGPHDLSGSIDIAMREETTAIVESVPGDDEAGAKKKKKKKKTKRRPKEHSSDEHLADIDVDPMAQSPDMSAQPAAADVDSENLDVSRETIDHSEDEVQQQMGTVEEHVTVVTKTTRSKKTRRRTPKKAEEDTDEL